MATIEENKAHAYNQKGNDTLPYPEDAADTPKILYKKTR